MLKGIQSFKVQTDLSHGYDKEKKKKKTYIDHNQCIVIFHSRSKTKNPYMLRKKEAILLPSHAYDDAISRTSEGMKANIKSTRRMPIGTSSNMKGGGGNGGSIRGRSSNEAVRQRSTSKDSTLK